MRTLPLNYIVVSLILASGGVACPPQGLPPAEQACCNTFRSRLDECGNTSDEVSRRVCMATARAAYRTCLNQIPRPAPQPESEQTCWDRFMDDLAECRASYPCDPATDPSRTSAPCQRRDACISGAADRYGWCTSRLMMGSPVLTIDLHGVLPGFVDPGKPKVRVDFELAGDGVFDVLIGVLACEEADADWRELRTLAKLVGVKSERFEVDVVFDTQLTKCNDAGVLVVVALDAEGAVAAVGAAEVGVNWDTRDLNRDGVIDIDDYNIALQRLADGSIGIELFSAIASAVLND